MVDGFVKPDDVIGSYTYTGITDSDEGGAVITHIYKLVESEVPNLSELPKDSPVHDKPEVKIPTPELPKPETPSVETSKPKPQEKYVTKELPNTGSESSALGLLGFAGLIGSLLLLKKQKED